MTEAVLNAAGAMRADPAATRAARLAAAVRRPAAARLRLAASVAVGLALLLYAAWVCDVFGPKLLAGLPKLGGALAMMLAPSGFQHLPEFLWALVETVAMALLGTLLGAIVALPLALVSARTTFPIRAAQFVFRRFSDALRSLDHLIWALVFVRAVGLGPLAGIMAIAIVDVGNLAKLYSEAIDNAARRPVEGVRASGGTWFDGVRLGVLPQVAPNMLAATLYMFESNTRSATILGIVGAGGIGYQLADRLRVYEFGQASLMIILIVITVSAIDALSGWLRARLIKGAGQT